MHQGTMSTHTTSYINLHRVYLFSGVSGCMLVLAAFMAGKEDVALYDGSWTEWYLRAKPEQMKCVPEGDS